jgi:hypothetical protein
MMFSTSTVFKIVLIACVVLLVGLMVQVNTATGHNVPHTKPIIIGNSP